MRETMTAAGMAVEPGTKTARTFPVAVRADGSEVALPVLIAAVRHRVRRSSSRPGFTAMNSRAWPPCGGCSRKCGRRTWPACWWRCRSPIRRPMRRRPAAIRTIIMDLARVFPGDRQGTVTEQLAFALTQSFLRHADFYCDLHMPVSITRCQRWSVTNCGRNRS